MVSSCLSSHYSSLKKAISLSCFSWIVLILFLGLIAPAHAQYKSYEIGGYSYAQFSSSEIASIDLYGTRGDLFAILIFLPIEDPDDLPAAEEGVDGIFRLYYKRERLGSVIDQLRNESPLVLNFWAGSGGQNSHVATMDVEPVGEGE